MAGIRLERESPATRIQEIERNTLAHQDSVARQPMSPLETARPTRLSTDAPVAALQLQAPAAQARATIRADGSVSVLQSGRVIRELPAPRFPVARAALAGVKTAAATFAATAGATLALLPDYHHINFAVAAAPSLASAAFGFATHAIFATDRQAHNTKQRREVALSPDGRIAATMQQHVGIDLIDVASGKRRSLSLVAQAMGFSADGRFVDVTTPAGVSRIEVASGRIVERMSDAQAITVSGLAAPAATQANARVTSAREWAQLKAEKQARALSLPARSTP